jgi:putative ABC transport system permease protein
VHVEPIRPPALQELGSVRSIPFGLGAVFAAAMATGLVLGITMSVRGRRHELWVLRALGADGRQRARTVLWHALTVALVAVAVGGPLGVALGRATARALLDSLGVAPGLAVPWSWLLAVGVGTVTIGGLAAAGPAWRAAHAPGDARVPE